jgi:LEA14-like dessication related protein
MTRRTPLLLLLAILVGACGPLYQRPDIQVSSVQVGSLGLTGGTLLVDVTVHNPNRFALESRAVRYELDIASSPAAGDTGWIEFARGTFDETITVAARDSATARIPVQFEYRALGGAANTILRSGTLTYRARGEADVGTPVGGRTVPFRHSGTVPIGGSR